MKSVKRARPLLTIFLLAASFMLAFFVQQPSLVVHAAGPAPNASCNDTGLQPQFIVYQDLPTNHTVDIHVRSLQGVIVSASGHWLQHPQNGPAAQGDWTATPGGGAITDPGVFGEKLSLPGFGTTDFTGQVVYQPTPGAPVCRLTLPDTQAPVILFTAD